MKFWTSKNILKNGSLYNYVIGERGNGKTTEILHMILKNYVEKKEKGVIIRRLETQITGFRAGQLWAGINGMGWVSTLTNGEYDRVIVKSSKCYLARFDDELMKVISSSEEFCHILALTQAEHNKSISFPDVTVIMFDEFLSKRHALRDEFSLFISTISTIVRHRKNAKVFLLGNTVTPRSIYFQELGIRNLLDMPQGTIAEYKRKNKNGEIISFASIEYCAKTEGGKDSDDYYSFKVMDDGTTDRSMEVDGDWDIGQYPRPTKAYSSKDIKKTILFTDGGYDINLTAKLVKVEKDIYLFVSRNSDNDGIPDDIDATYSLVPSSDPRTYMDPTRSYGNRFTTLIAVLLKEERVFFDSNNSGEEMAEYIVRAQSYSLTNI